MSGPRAFTATCAALVRREALRFLRQRSRLLGALGQPVLFWILLGAGLGPSFRPAGLADGVTYAAWFFPGTVLLVVLFTAIFTTISVIEDRREGFLQAVLVAPVPRVGIVAGKIAGGATLAFGEGMLLLAAAPLAGWPLSPAAFAAAGATLGLIALALTALGFCIAWRMESTQGFHLVMNLLLMPMWLLSGAFFPMAGTADWLAVLMRINPLTYGMAALRRTLGMAGGPVGEAVPALVPSLAVVALFLLAATAVAVLQVSRRGSGKRA